MMVIMLLCLLSYLRTSRNLAKALYPAGASVPLVHMMKSNSSLNREPENSYIN